MIEDPSLIGYFNSKINGNKISDKLPKTNIRKEPIKSKVNCVLNTFDSVFLILQNKIYNEYVVGIIIKIIIAGKNNGPGKDSTYQPMYTKFSTNKLENNVIIEKNIYIIK